MKKNQVFALVPSLAAKNPACQDLLLISPHLNPKEVQYGNNVAGHARGIHNLVIFAFMKP